MGFVLDSGATIMCPHGGKVAVVPSNTTVQVGGNFALLATDVFTVSGCPFSTPAGPMPCVAVQWTTHALVTQVNGVPVLLSDSVGMATGPSGGGPVTVTGFQTQVQGS